MGKRRLDSKAVSTRSTHALLVTVIVLSLHCIHAQNLVGYTYSCTILGTQDVFADVGGQGFSYSPDPLQECKNYVSGQTNDVRYTGTSHYGPPPDYFTYWVYECRYCVNNPCPTLTGWYYTTANSCNKLQCATCSAGTYSTCGGTSAGSCLACTNNVPNSIYTASGTNSTNCPWVCSTGYTLSNGSCVWNCPAGQTGIPCTSCSSGYYKGTNDSAACTNAANCGAGSYRPTKTGCTTQDCVCPTCTAGNYCPAGASAQTPCSTG